MTSSKFRWALGALLVALVPAVRPAAAQTMSTRSARVSSTPDIVGTWQARTRPAQAKGKDAVQRVVIRPDSSASYGREIVRWRMRPGQDTVLLALGGEWVAYKVQVKGDQLTLSGGDLNEPVTLKRVGPATPRPAGVQVPGDPDTEE